MCRGGGRGDGCEIGGDPLLYRAPGMSASMTSKSAELPRESAMNSLNLNQLTNTNTYRGQLKRMQILAKQNVSCRSRQSSGAGRDFTYPCIFLSSDLGSLICIIQWLLLHIRNPYVVRVGGGRIRRASATTSEPQVTFLDYSF